MQTCHCDSISTQQLQRPPVPGQLQRRQHSRSTTRLTRRTLCTATASPAAPPHARLASSHKYSAAAVTPAVGREFPASTPRLYSQGSALVLQAQATPQQFSSPAAFPAANGADRIAAAAAATAAAGPGPPPTAAAAASAAAVAYSAADTADTWNRRPVPVVARLCEIGVAFGWWVAGGCSRLCCFAAHWRQQR